MTSVIVLTELLRPIKTGTIVAGNTKKSLTGNTGKLSIELELSRFFKISASCLLANSIIKIIIVVI